MTEQTIKLTAEEIAVFAQMLNAPEVGDEYLEEAYHTSRRERIPAQTAKEELVKKGLLSDLSDQPTLSPFCADMLSAYRSPAFTISLTAMIGGTMQPHQIIAILANRAAFVAYHKEDRNLFSFQHSPLTELPMHLLSACGFAGEPVPAAEQKIEANLTLEMVAILSQWFTKGGGSNKMAQQAMRLFARNNSFIHTITQGTPKLVATIRRTESDRDTQPGEPAAGKELFLLWNRSQILLAEFESVLDLRTPALMHTVDSEEVRATLTRLAA